MAKIIKLKESDIERLVKKIIKEESTEETENNPMDVERFLDLADKYLFSRYSRYAEKIDTPVEKAKLIAALAEKWGIGVDELSRVKSVMNKNESITKKKSRLDEIGYDDPGIMASHLDRIFSVLRGTFSDFSIILEVLTNKVVKGESKEDILQDFDKLHNTIQMLQNAVEMILEEVQDVELRNGAKKFANLLGGFSNKIKTLKSYSLDFSEEDFNNTLANILTKLAESVKPFGHSIIKSLKKYQNVFTGRDRGSFGSSFDI